MYIFMNMCMCVWIYVRICLSHYTGIFLEPVKDVEPLPVRESQVSFITKRLDALDDSSTSGSLERGDMVVDTSIELYSSVLHSNLQTVRFCCG